MTRAERTYPRIIELDIPGITLAGNPLDDPSERRIPVYLPPSYDGKNGFRLSIFLRGLPLQEQVS